MGATLSVTGSVLRAYGQIAMAASSSIEQLRLAFVLVALIFRRLCKFFPPEVVGFRLAHICEDKIVYVRVPVDRLAFDTFLDVLGKRVSTSNDQRNV